MFALYRSHIHRECGGFVVYWYNLMSKWSVYLYIMSQDSLYQWRYSISDLSPLWNNQRRRLSWERKEKAIKKKQIQKIVQHWFKIHSECQEYIGHSKLIHAFIRFVWTLYLNGEYWNPVPIHKLYKYHTNLEWIQRAFKSQLYLYLVCMNFVLRWRMLKSSSHTQLVQISYKPWVQNILTFYLSTKVFKIQWQTA